MCTPQLLANAASLDVGITPLWRAVATSLDLTCPPQTRLEVIKKVPGEGKNQFVIPLQEPNLQHDLHF